RWRELELTAQELLARKSPGDWNQAMMELGATVCTPKSPECGSCPVTNWCQAQKLGIQAELPSVRKKPATGEVTIGAGILLDPEGNTLLFRLKDAAGELFSRMWQFPATQVGDDATNDISRYLSAKFKITLNGNLYALAPARHAVTYRDV